MNLGWTRGHDPSDLTLRHGRFRDDVATLAAALHGRSKEQIDSEDDTVFSPDGRLLIAASDDGTVQVWTLGALPAVAANPVGPACQLTGGGYTRSEWDQHAQGTNQTGSGSLGATEKHRTS